jgi:hypothetical protein
MAQILTQHVYDDCEAIIEKFGCACITFSDRIVNALNEERTITLTADEMLEEGFSKSFIENFDRVVTGCRVWFNNYLSNTPSIKFVSAGSASNPSVVSTEAYFVWASSIHPVSFSAVEIEKIYEYSSKSTRFIFRAVY